MICLGAPGADSAVAFDGGGRRVPVAARVPRPMAPVLRSSTRAMPEFHGRPRRRRAARAFALLLVTPATLAPGSAPAHAIIVAAQPAMNATVAAGEIAIRLDFNSRLDTRRSGLS